MRPFTGLYGMKITSGDSRAHTERLIWKLSFVMPVQFSPRVYVVFHSSSSSFFFLLLFHLHPLFHKTGVGDRKYMEIILFYALRGNRNEKALRRTNSYMPVTNSFSPFLPIARCRKPRAFGICAATGTPVFCRDLLHICIVKPVIIYSKDFILFSNCYKR